MPDCDYCEESFGDEQSYLEHLRADHEGELGTIDKRRVEEEFESGGEGGLPTGPLVLGVTLVAAVGLVAFIVFIAGNGGGGSGTVNDISVEQMPGDVSRSAHGHGPINVSINGVEIDFSQAEYQRPRRFSAFHFEGGNGEIWHKHATGVTLEYAMATLGFEVSEDSVTIGGITYNDSDPGTSVSVTVNGEPVDPATYELQGASTQNAAEGDFIRITVTTEDGSDG